MKEEDLQEPKINTQDPNRIPRLLFSITAVFLLFLSISGFMFIESNRSHGNNPVAGTGIPSSTNSMTPIYLDTPPPQAEFYDTFKNNAQNWSVSNTSGYFRTVNPGELVLSNTNQGTTLVESLPTNSVYANCTVIVDFTMLKVGLNDSVGIFIRGDTNLEHDYRVDLYGSGNFDITKEYLDSKNNPQSIILAKSKINSILKPQGDQNTILLTMDGPRLRLYINNVKVSSITDNDYPSGQVALFAQLDRSSQGVTVSFSRVEIDKITGTLNNG